MPTEIQSTEDPIEEPEEAQQPLQAQQVYGPGDLDQSIILAFADSFQTLQGREMYDRRIEVLTDRLHRFYDDGIQHVYPNYGTGTYQIGTAGATVNIGGDSITCPDYIGSYNIFYPIGRALDAVLTQNPPGIDFRPDDPSVSEDIEASETGEGYRAYFDQSNDVKEIQQKISRMFRLSGRTVIEVETIEDRQRWGVNEQGEPRKMETANVFGTLESKCSILGKCMKDLPYIFLYSDHDELIMKDEYPDIADKIKGGQNGLGESDWERFARIGVQQARKGYFLTGNSGAHITTRIKGYLRPAAFGKYTNLYDPADGSGDGKTTVGEKIKEIFPDGVRVIYVGQNFACAENMGMDDHITIGFPKERDGMTGGALMRDMVVVQDVVNDYKNAERSFYEKGWPSLWIDAEDTDYDTIMDQKSEPAAIRQKKRRDPGTPLADDFYREPDMQLPESFVQEIANMAGPFAQFVSGALPAIQGEDSPGDKTASGKAMDRSQAMGMLGMPWANMQRIFASMYYQAALLAAANPDHSKEIVVPGEGGTNAVLRLENLTKGNFGVYPDLDSSFPESTAAKRANLQAIIPMLAGAPQIAQEFFASPDNWEEMLDLMGISGMQLNPAEAYKKQTREFELLLRESPVPDTQALQQAQIQHATASVVSVAQGGAPPPPPDPAQFMKSSVPVQPEDFHIWEYAKCQEWLSSDACWRAQAEPGGEVGIENIRLHARAHQAAMVAQMPPPMAQPPAKPKQPHGGAPEANTQVQQNSAPPGAPQQPTL